MPRICIINFASYYDWRMARELVHITKHYDVTIVGFREIYEQGESIEWKFIERKSTFFSRLWDRAITFIGRVFPPAYDVWFWRRQRYRDGLAAALAVDADAYQANDWAALPVAVEAAKRKQAKVVYDAHEYWTLEAENQPMWKLFFSPLIRHFEKRNIPRVNALISVSPPIVERYGREYPVRTMLITNAPELISLPTFSPTASNRIRLINHGSAVRDRHLERMIEAMPYTDERFTLDLILLPIEPDYIEELKALAQRIAPNRVTFHQPLPKSEILARVSEYDMGIFIIPPVSYNYHNALPNRFFDFIAAGLAVCVGPSPAMKAIVEQYGVGIAAPTFDAKDIGAALNVLTSEQIDQMKLASREASKHLNAQIENKKWAALYGELFRN